MVSNYFKIAWRNILKNKFYAVLNIGGLALGITCSLFIYLYINYNLHFDTYHKQASNIFRLVNEVHLENTEYDKGSSFAAYDALKKSLPQINQSAFLIDKQTFTIDVEGPRNKRFKEEKNISFADANWFGLFTYNLIAGSLDELNDPNKAVIRKSIATKYFGNADAIGKVLLFNGHSVKVAGIINDGPYNTNLKGDIFVSLSSLKTLNPLYGKDFFTDWGYINSTNNAFIKLDSPAQKDAVESQIPLLAKQAGRNDILKYYHFKLLPLPEAHFDSRYGGTVDKKQLLIIALIGILIMAIALINYINLAIAQQTKRTIEIGTRKVLGGSSTHIFLQFIAESLFTAFISIILAGVALIILLPWANTYIFVHEPIYILSYTALGGYAFIILLVVTAGAGIYPALVLSRINVNQALKNNLFNFRIGIIRKALIVFQNTSTQALIACAIIIVIQVNYLRSTDIGFNRDMVITVPLGKIDTSQTEVFKQKLREMPEVQSFSFCNNTPSSDSHRGATVKYNNRNSWEKWAARFAVGDSSYYHTFGLQLVAGRNIRNQSAVPEFLVNESMATMLEGKRGQANVIGKTLSPGEGEGIIVGIVKDFNVRSLSENIEPTVLLQNADLQNNLAIKLSGNKINAFTNKLHEAFTNVLPNEVFSYDFVDDQIAALYQKETVQQKLIWLGAVVAIIVSSLGLLGLVSIITVQRTKEIGIRKILGASIMNITAMLSKDFIILVIIAIVVALPIAWWAMNKWLQNFAHHITLHWWFFAAAGLLTLVIAALTISLKSIRTAMANPVKSLRND